MAYYEGSNRISSRKRVFKRTRANVMNQKVLVSIETKTFDFKMKFFSGAVVAMLVCAVVCISSTYLI